MGERISITVSGSAIRRGTPAAVEALFDRYHEKVYGLAISILKNNSDAEAAQVLGLTVATIKSRLHRTRLYLRERLSRYLRDGRMA